MALSRNTELDYCGITDEFLPFYCYLSFVWGPILIKMLIIAGLPMFLYVTD